MNILISSIYSYNSYARGIMPDVLQTQIDQNPRATIYYLTNSHSFNVCYFNIEKKPEICYLCKTGVQNTLKLIKGNFEHIIISDIVKEEDKIFAAEFFMNKDQITFDQVYENFEVGAATLSTYISRTRDRNLTEVRKPFVKELAVNALALYLGVKRFLKSKNIDTVYNFNGRQEYVRAVMRAAMALNLDCYNVERTRLNGHIDFYKNVFPHDPAAKFGLVQKYWQESDLPDEEKENIGSRFYDRQRSGESVIFPSYSSKMEKGNIPKEYLNGNKNLILFNSSDDETVAFGDLFKYPLFNDQNEGLSFMVQLVGKKLLSYNLIIRMHPNLQAVNFEYVQTIRNLHQKYPNIFVVPPESTTDTYALMNIAEKVITFGSTTGLEANFIGKPVILLGKGFFYFADYAYKPESRREIEELLRKKLEPRPLKENFKIGFYLQAGGVKTEFYNEVKLGEGIYFKKKRIHFYSPWQRIKAKLIQRLSKISKSGGKPKK